MKRHGGGLPIPAAQPRRRCSLREIRTLREDPFAVASARQVRTIDELGIAVARVAPAAAAVAELLGGADVHEGPIPKRPALLVLPEAPMRRTPEIVTVEDAREGFTGSKTDDAWMGRIRTVIHGLPS